MQADPGRLNAIAENLMEARRYIRTNPDYVRSVVPTSIPDVYDSVPRLTADRIVCNLGEGLEMIQVDPLILEGNLYAAARLLQSIVRRIEREDADAVEPREETR